MRIIKADAIFDGEKFIPFNAVVIKDGKIKDLLLINEQNISEYVDVEVYEGIIVPGFINAHCHLELSYLHHQFTPQCGMVGFLNQMFEKRHLFDEQQIIQAAEMWDKKMYEHGIVAVGDIVNNAHALEIKSRSKIRYTNFIEVFGLNKNNADIIFQKAILLMDEYRKWNLNAQMVPHSPYSLSDSLWNKVLDFVDKEKNNPASMHFLESMDEINIIEGLPSKMRDYFVNNLRFSDMDLIHISKNFYIYLKNFLDLSKKLILVHNTYLNEKYIHALSNYKEKVFFCLCPRANLFIENRLPDLNLISEFTENICIGTDSLASNYNLNIIDELNVILEHFDVDIQEILKWATLNGAKALGIEDCYGCIKRNYSASINIVIYQDKVLSLVAAIH